MARVLAAILAIGLMAGTAFAQGSVSGAWDLIVNGPEGPINATANLKQDGEKLSGSIETPQGTAEMAGSLKGKALNLSFSIQGPQGPLEIKVNGEVDGASMKGIIDFGMGMAEFTAKKK
ncbi:MAG TPA: hypothetical protein VEA16_16530 [Vicinamibacterales bacterium]|nr:hypothetical protein [Vicinamibacterales bacterium]